MSLPQGIISLETSNLFYENEMVLHANEDIQTFATNYNAPVDHFINDTNMAPSCKNEAYVFVDLSINDVGFEAICKILDAGCRVIWIDHHKSSNEYAGKIIEYINTHNNAQCRVIIDTNRSGALLAWELTFNTCYNYTGCFHQFNKNYPTYVEYVDDYDRWIYKYGDDTITFSLGYDTYEGHEDVKSEFHRRLIQSVVPELHHHPDFKFDDNKSIEFMEEIVNKGRLIKSYIDSQNESMYRRYGFHSTIRIVNNETMEEKEFEVAAINRSSNSWIFGEDYDKYPAVIVFTFDPEKLIYKYSIYSNNKFEKDIDCSEIAKLFCGGGHRGAAGFSCPKNIFTEAKIELDGYTIYITTNRKK